MDSYNKNKIVWLIVNTENISRNPNTVHRLCSQKSMFLTDVASEELHIILKQLTNKFSAERDDINIIVLKISWIYVLNSLCSIINQSLQNGVFPLRLKSAIVRPIFKKVDPKMLKTMGMSVCLRFVKG